jgi:hypothetical protein
LFDTWRKRTLDEGACGSGTVMHASQDVLYVKMTPAGEPYEYKRTFRVTFPDGSTGETQETVPLHSVQHLAGRRTIDCWSRLAERTKSGATVPVRYDESDHSHVVLDLPALIQEILASLDQSPGT